MGRLQNNPPIGWVHPKSTHERPLAWGNKNRKKASRAAIIQQNEWNNFFHLSEQIFIHLFLSSFFFLFGSSPSLKFHHVPVFGCEDILMGIESDYKKKSFRLERKPGNKKIRA
jgi:hypothetical protein